MEKLTINETDYAIKEIAIKNTPKVLKQFSKLLAKISTNEEVQKLIGGLDKDTDNATFVTQVVPLIPEVLDIAFDDAIALIATIADIKPKVLEDFSLSNIIELLTVIVRINDISGIMNNLKNLTGALTLQASR